MVSIHDIAREVGVSATTVSRVLNNKSASAKTRARVLKAVEKSGYVPDARAVSLKRGSNKIIGIIIPDISNPVYPIGVKVIHDIARERGYHLILGNTYGRVDEELELLRMMMRERVAGLIVATCEGEDDTACNAYLDEIRRSGGSVVLMGREKGNLGVDEISVDNTKGVYRGTQYLLKTGRKKIGFLVGRSGPLAREGRLAGYRRALSEAGAKQKEIVIMSEEWTRESGRREMENYLENGGNPDGLFCGNDLLAIGAMEAVRKSGRSVPGDVALVGFDDIEQASLVTPQLTTVRQPHQKVASLACSLLLDRIEGRERGGPKEILVEPELIVRESA